jgi:ribosomal protein S27E
MMNKTEQQKSVPQPLRCPKCGGFHVSYASYTQKSVTCNDCGFTEARAAIVAGGSDPTSELVKALAAGAFVTLATVGTIALLNALFGDNKK